MFSLNLPIVTSARYQILVYDKRKNWFYKLFDSNQDSNAIDRMCHDYDNCMRSLDGFYASAPTFHYAKATAKDGTQYKITIAVFTEEA